MSEMDPKRWNEDEEAPARIRDVLRAGRDVPKMPDAVRAAVLGALGGPAPGGGGSGGEGSGGAAPGGAAPGGAAPVTSVGLSAGTIGGGAAFVVAAVAAIVWFSSTPPSRERTPSQVDPSAASAAVAPTAPTAPTATLQPSAAASASSTVVAASAPVTSPTPASTTSAPRARASGSALPTGDTLAEESALIGRARASLASNPGATLAAVDDHAARFARGELASEREYLRISALRRLGRVDEAKTHAKSYLVKYPSSPQAAAVRTFLAEIPSP